MVDRRQDLFLVICGPGQPRRSRYEPGPGSCGRFRTRSCPTPPGLHTATVCGRSADIISVAAGGSVPRRPLPWCGAAGRCGRAKVGTRRLSAHARLHGRVPDLSGQTSVVHNRGAGQMRGGVALSGAVTRIFRGLRVYTGNPPGIDRRRSEVVAFANCGGHSLDILRYCFAGSIE